MSDMDTYRNYASKVHIFHGLQPEEVGHIIKKGEVVSYSRGKPSTTKGRSAVASSSYSAGKWACISTRS